MPADEILVEKYSSAVYGLVYHMVGNFAKAQDLAQEVFITAYLRIHQLGRAEKEEAKLALSLGLAWADSWVLYLFQFEMIL
jgi:DNA-directed RNA polymerase specialized sigma24 family protein